MLNIQLKRLVILGTLICPIVLAGFIWGWESIFVAGTIWFLMWFVLLAVVRGLWGLGKETKRNNDL